jgi:hypothetical protein
LGEGKDKRETIISIVQAVIKKTEEKEEMAKSKGKKEAKKEAKEVAPETNAVCTEAAVIKINENYKKMIPRPTKEQYSLLEKGILKDGLKEKLRVLPDNTLYDGHTRYDILTKHNLPITKDMVEIHDLAPEAIEYEIFCLNVQRRHLTDLQKISKIKKFMPEIKAEIQKEKEIKKKTEPAISKKKERKEGGVKLVAPEKKKDEGAITRRKIAEKAGVSPAEVAQHTWLEKWAPGLLKEAEEKSIKTGTVYLRAQEMYKLVKEHAPEKLEEIKDKKIALEEVYEKLLETLPAEATEPKPGPFETLLTKIKDQYWKILKEKYGDDVTPDKFEVKFVNALDTLVLKYSESEKKKS